MIRRLHQLIGCKGILAAGIFAGIIFTLCAPTGAQELSALLRSDMGLKSGTQPGPGYYFSFVYYDAEYSSVVTRRLRNMIQTNTLDVKVNNDNMGGDPNVGADKSVKVDYTYRGQTLHKVVKEGDRLKLP